MLKSRVAGTFPVLIALLQVALVVSAIEWFHPYFFLQDDNRTFLLPQIVHNWRALTQGQLAEFNFYQYCGTPALSNGQAGALYPPNYVAVGLSLLLFGGPWAAIDVLTLVHLLIGAAGGYFALRQIGLGKLSASWAGAASVLNSFIIYAGNSWPGVTAAAAYFPWALAFTTRLALGRTGAAAGLITAHVLWILNGHPQFFLYGVTFEAVAFLVVVLGLRRSDLIPATARYLVALAAGLLIAAPLLLPMMRQTSLSAERSSPLDWQDYFSGKYRPHLWLAGLLFPLSEAWFDRTPATDYIPRMSAYTSHVGYAVMVFAAIAVAGVLRGRVPPDLRARAAVFSCFAALAALWSGGALALPLYYLPIFNRMRWPYKLQLYTALFTAFVAACGLEHALRGKAARRRGAIFAATVTLTVLNCFALYASTNIKTFRRSVAVLPWAESSTGAFARGRVASVAYEWGDLDAPGSLGFNYPTLFEIQAFGGYDPLVTRLNSGVALGLNHMSSLPCETVISKLPHLRDWAVAYYVVAPRAKACHRALESAGMLLIEHDQRRHIYLDASAARPASWEDGTTAGLDCRVGINDIECLSSLAHPARLKLRFAAHPQFSAFIDGRRTALSAQDGQLSMLVPSGSRSIKLVYRDEMTRLGFRLSAATLFALALSSLLIEASSRAKLKRAAARG